MEDVEDDDFAEIEPTNILYGRTRRAAAANIDYSSEEALQKAGLSKGDASGAYDEDDAEFKVGPFFRFSYTSFTLHEDLGWPDENADSRPTLSIDAGLKHGRLNVRAPNDTTPSGEAQRAERQSRAKEG